MNIQSALVRSILEKWRAYQWTTQGFGMVRTKLADVGRIHVWDSRLAEQHVSTMHAHPWPLHSTVVSGELINQRFTICPDGANDTVALAYQHSRIATGEGGGLIGEPQEVRLLSRIPEVYYPGDSYEQAPDEIHRSIPQDGTVTLLTRPMGPPLQETSVYWPTGAWWVSAEPRPPKDNEVERAVGYALARWAAS